MRFHSSGPFPVARALAVTFLAVLVLAAVGNAALAQTPRGAASAELRAAHAFDEARKQGPLALQAFLTGMPKGADLHVHFSGAVYAETFLRDAAQDGICIDRVEMALVKPTASGGCADGQVKASELIDKAQTPTTQDLYDEMIDALSMRNFVPSTARSGHMQFFDTFDRWGAVDKRHTGEWLDEIASRAAAQNEQYIEIMDTPPFGHAAGLAHQIGWDSNLAEFRKKLLDAGIDDEIAAAQERIKNTLDGRNQIEHCGTPDAMPACKVEIRFIYQILRSFPRDQIFAQTLLGFETISKIPEFVGINFVRPEDGYLSMTDYTLHMQMMDYLHSVYPSVHISLHAGELAPGLVPPEGIRFHIRQAVELGHAERIGHGVDVMYEDDAPGLLKELAAKHVMIEINLTSNDGILGIKGPTGEHAHPLPNYRRAGVPVALSTDDEGVSRTTITHEYLRAAEEFGLSYLELKQMARTGMEHNFLPGKSLWATQDVFTVPEGACAGQPLGSEKPSVRCQTFLDANEKAAAQWEQEKRFRAFEGKW